MEDKKILFILADRDFRDEEYTQPRSVFENEGIEIKVANESGGESQGVSGTKVQADLNLDQVVASDYDAIIFVGGAGAIQYFDNDTIWQIARDAFKHNKIVAAICIAPVILAKAGILKGKKATVFESGRQHLEANGAIYTGNAVEIDGNIITANGPNAAENFAKTIIELLRKQ